MRYIFYRIFIDVVLISDLQNHHFFLQHLKNKKWKINRLRNQPSLSSLALRQWLKSMAKKSQTSAKMKTKISQNPVLEPSWGLLGASWAPLGRVMKKTLKKLEKNHVCGPQLGRQNPTTIRKNRCKKRIRFEICFFIEFS